MPKICIDAGHYAKCNWNPKTEPVYWESLMAWTLHIMLKEELERYEGVEVIITRQEEEKDLDLTARGRAAIGCDLFLSLHSNAGVKAYNETVDRAVTIYPVSGKEAALAASFAQTITKTMGLKDKPQTYSRWNSANNADYYGVIRGAASVGVPGLILEHSFHTNNAVAEWLLDENNLRKLAIAEAKVIADRYGCVLKDAGATKPATGGDAYADYTPPYRVIVGAFNNPRNALDYRDDARQYYPGAYVVDTKGKVLN